MLLARKFIAVYKKAVVKPVKRRCLGPGPEHTFRSTDKGHRICNCCRKKLEKAQLVHIAEVID